MGDDRKHGAKVTDLGHVLEIQPPGLAVGLDLGWEEGEEKRKIKNC